MCHCLVLCRYPCDIRLNQAAKGSNSDPDELVNLLESIEDFLKRVDIYTRIPPTPAMDEIVFDVIVELLNVLALATRKLKRGRSSESIFAHALLPYSAQRSQICKESFRKEGF